MALQALDVALVKAVAHHDLAPEALQQGLPRLPVRLLFPAVGVKDQFPGHPLPAVGREGAGPAGKDRAVGQGEGAVHRVTQKFFKLLLMAGHAVLLQLPEDIGAGLLGHGTAGQLVQPAEVAQVFPDPVRIQALDNGIVCHGPNPFLLRCFRGNQYPMPEAMSIKMPPTTNQMPNRGSMNLSHFS